MMPQKCTMAGCFNRSDNRDRWVVMPHVTELAFHTCPELSKLPLCRELVNHGHNHQELPAPHHHQQELPALHQHTVCSNHFPLGYPDPDHPLPSLYLSGYGHDNGAYDDNDGEDDDKEFVKASIHFRNVRETDHDYPKLRRSHEGGEKAGDMITHLKTECKEEADSGDAESCLPDCESEKTLGESSVNSCHSAALNCDQQKEGAILQGGKLVEGCSGSSKSSANEVVIDSMDCATVSLPGNIGEDSLNASAVAGAGCSVTLSEATLPGREISLTSRGQAVRGGRKRQVSHDTDHMYNTRRSKCRKQMHNNTSTSRSSRSKRHTDNDHPYNSTHVDNTGASRQSDHPYNSRLRSDRDSSFSVDSRQTDHPYNFRHGTKTNGASSIDSRQSDHAYNSRQCSNGDFPEDSGQSDHPYNFRHGTKTHSASTGHLDNSRQGINNVDVGFPKDCRKSDHQYNSRHKSSADRPSFTPDSRFMDHCYNSTRHKPSVEDSAGSQDHRETESAHCYNSQHDSKTSVTLTERHIACPIRSALDHPYYTCRWTDRASSSRSLRNRRKGSEHRYNNSKIGNVRSSAAIDFMKDRDHQPNNSTEANIMSVGDHENIVSSSSLAAKDGDHLYNSRPTSDASSSTSSEDRTRDTDHVYRDNDHVYKDTEGVHRESDHICKNDHVYRETDVVHNGSPRTSAAVVAAVSRDRDHMYNMPTPTLTKLPSTESCLPCSQADSQGQVPLSSFQATAASVGKDHMYQHSLRKRRQRADNKGESKNSSISGSGGGSLARKPLRRYKGSNDYDTSNKSVERKFKKTPPKSEKIKIVPTKKADVVDEVSETEKKSLVRGCVTKCVRKVRRGSVKRQKKKPMSSQGGSHSPGGSTSTQGAPSPALSDVECDPSASTCDDDQSDVWRMDHMYVHFSSTNTTTTTTTIAKDNDVNDNTPTPTTQLSDVNRQQEPQPSLLSPLPPPCLNYRQRQEHSYANSEEQRFAACSQCSSLVQQLISTIQQQCQHIDQLKKQLTAANATNRQLSARVVGNRADTKE